MFEGGGLLEFVFKEFLCKFFEGEVKFEEGSFEEVEVIFCEVFFINNEVFSFE